MNAFDLTGPPLSAAEMTRAWWRILRSRPLLMFGLPALAYAVCQVVGLLIGVQAPGWPTVVDHRQVAVGPGGLTPWTIWLLLVGVATAIIVGTQLTYAGIALWGAGRPPNGRLLGTAGRAAGCFGMLMAIFSIPVAIMLVAPAYWLNIVTTYSGSDVEDMRLVGMMALIPVSLVAMVVVPLAGRYFLFAVPVTVFENISVVKSITRSMRFSRSGDLFGPLALHGVGMILLAVGLIFAAAHVPGDFQVKFGVGMWLFLVLVEAAHVALATVLYMDTWRVEHEV